MSYDCRRRRHHCVRGTSGRVVLVVVVVVVVAVDPPCDDVWHFMRAQCVRDAKHFKRLHADSEHAVEYNMHDYSPEFKHLHAQHAYGG